MVGIYTMMLVVYAAGIVIWGGLIFFLNGLKPRRLWLLLVGLPLSALANIWIKTPLVHAVARLWGISLDLGAHSPWWFLLFLLLVAPVLEEPIKLLPLALPPVRHQVRSASSAIWIGLALGVSFGLGEAAFLAYNIATTPANIALPASVFTGYAIERWMYCLLHGVMTAIFLMGIQHGRWHILTGYLSAILLHSLVSSVALFTQVGMLPADVAQWIILLEFLLALLLLAWLWRRAGPTRKAILPTNPQNAA